MIETSRWNLTKNSIKKQAKDKLFILGDLSTMLILNENDFKDLDRLEANLLGKGFEVILVPRELNSQEFRILERCIMDGINQIGHLINYNTNEQIRTR